MADGRVRLVGTGEEAIEVAFAEGSFVVSPRGPGWSATCERATTASAMPRRMARILRAPEGFVDPLVLGDGHAYLHRMALGVGRRRPVW